MRRVALAVVGVVGVVAIPAAAEVPVTLRGSPASMVRQHEVAKSLEYTFVRTPAELNELRGRGALVSIEGNEDFEIAGFVSYAEARPEVRTFIHRFAAAYRAATGEKLVVTSLTRPTSLQPRNSHELSVHPTGMAVDLRVSQRAASREWLEATLLAYEREGLLDVTRERTPPHYHVALFPEPYMAHVAQLEAREAEKLAAAAAAMSRIDAYMAAGSAFLQGPASEVRRTDRGANVRLAAAVAVVLGAMALRWALVPTSRGSA